MATATKTVSVRLPTSLVQEATDLSPQKKVSEIISEALSTWVAKRRRQYEDDVISRALSSVSSDQKRKERELIGMAGQSSLRALERLDG